MEMDSVFIVNSREQITNNPLLDQLPSYQSLLYRRKSSTIGSKRRSSSRGRFGSFSSVKSSGNTIKQHDDKEQSPLEQRPVRELAKSMKEKRRERDQRSLKAQDLGNWSQWRQNTRRGLKRLKDNTEDRLNSLKLWRSDIHQIEAP